jgi:hypothetical protein
VYKVFLAALDRLHNFRKRPTIHAIAQPEFTENNVPELGFVAVEPNRKPLQAGNDTGAVYKTQLH